MGGLAAMALTIVYPTLKPMLEASIRRITVSVKWSEGSSQRSFDIAEYVTNPMQGLPPVGSAAAGMDPLSTLLGAMGMGSSQSPAAPVGGR